MLATGQQVDRYIVEGRLGEGGMATVYRVRHETLGTPAALKVLTITARDIRKRLVQEGQVQATLQHENIVRVTDVLDVHGAPGLLMEFVEGPTLEHWLTRYQPSLEEALTLFRGICCGVGLAHAKGLVHRDLKPANILLAITDDRMTPKVTDFGLAKAVQTPELRGRTKTGATMGTPGYMAPEQIRDASSVDRRADLWSLGCILYRLACGVPPFEGDDIIELFNQVANGDYLSSRDIRRDLPDSVHDAIDAMLTVERARRVADCGELIAFLDGDVTELNRPIYPGTLPKPTTPSTDRPRWLPGASEAADVARSQFDETLGHLPKLKPYREKIDHDWSETPGPSNRLPEALDQHTDTHEQVTLVPPPIRRTVRRGWMVGIAGVGAAIFGGVVLVLGLVAAFMIVSTGTSTDSPDLDGVEPPSPIVQAPTPEPEPTAAPAADPVVQDPVPSRVVPVVPTPPPPRPSSGGTAAVNFTGARTMWLEGEESGEVIRELGKVPPGGYRIKAIFEGEPNAAVAGRVTLRAGDEITLRCVAEMSRCK